MSSFVESIRLLNVELCIDHLVVRKKFIENDAFAVSVHTLYFEDGEEGFDFYRG